MTVIALVAGYNYILCGALVAGFSLHFHDHAWHMHLCGALVAGIAIIFCVDALVAGIISGSYSYKSMHLTHNCIESVVYM